MFLKSLEVRNFRGVVTGRLDLDETTVLIGENDCGKSSLLAALEVVLAAGNGDRPAIEVHHFHRPRDPSLPLQGPVRIDLLFEERAAGEWSEESMGTLVALLPAPSAGSRKLVVSVTAEAPSGDSAPLTHWRIFSPGAGDSASDDDTTHLGTIRRLCPLVWLRSGMLMGATVGGTPVEAQPPAGDGLAQLAGEVESHYQALLAGTSDNELEELKAGYEAARELLKRRAEEYHSAGSLAQAPVAEVLGRRGEQRPAGVAFHGSAAQQIGVLIVTAAIIRHGLGKWAAGTTPLLVVEDPESHLHPMTLASVWGLMEHARAQKVIGTQSATLLAAAPLESIRRLTRTGGRMRQWRVQRGTLSGEDTRKLSYHLRARRGEAMFARCWLLVEGETEFWMMSEMARLSGYDLNLEGVAPVEFAQCGLPPLIRLAGQLGIEWHVLTDGDRTGGDYANEARSLAGDEVDWRLTRLRERDIEHCLWRHGYSAVYLRSAGIEGSGDRHATPYRVIQRAIKRYNKPYLAFQVLAAVAEADSPGVPPPLRHTLDTCIQLAREAPARSEADAPRPPRKRRHHGRGRRGSRR
jgi:putative ATP-dependent endonuclease of OLD family